MYVNTHFYFIMLNFSPLLNLLSLVFFSCEFSRVFKYRIMPSRTRDNVTSFPVKMTFSFSLDKRNVLYRTSDTIINGSGESRQIKTGSGFFLQKVYFSYRTFAN